MNPAVLTVYKSPFPKLRLGKDYDGGYIIAEIPNIKYTILLAGGIETDISFEEDFINRYPTVKTYAFDGTINNLPKENNNIIFINKNIGFENNDHITNLHDIINANEYIFVKMDIEGGEIPWIKSLNNDQMNKFEQIVMEFHNPFYDNEIDVFDKINENHFLIHFHGNNCCGVRNHNGVVIPNIFECTYLHKKYFTNFPELSKDLIPSNLDMKNTGNDEIYIDYPPFVNIFDKSYSQLGQDLEVIKFYNNKENGFFIEIGASDGIELSNTYLLEKQYKWKGICCEPIPSRFEKLVANRRNSICFNEAVYNQSGLTVTLDIANHNDILSGISEHIDKHKSFVDLNKTSIQVQTISLLDVLNNANAPLFIEYMSLDTEGSELEILQNFDFEKYTFGLIDVEHNYVEPRRTKIMSLLLSKGYIYKGENEWDDMYKHNSV